MSWVANLMVSVVAEDRSQVESLSEWLRNRAPRQGGSSILGCGYLLAMSGPDSQWGGWKYPECEVWAGTLNHADLGAVLDRVRKTPWQVPDALQVFLKDQEDAYFRLWMFRDGGLRQCAPALPSEADADFLP
ncbi:hypothetical protein [Amycolatopsis sp. H20-H5]|uniref:hypothetical protein n=1 Tax=Amycolatopsis sp. H20-H5 TaxID=3046309 RepID=UPI002DB7852D|nr:hypothetical protein [Amycolatopsis sp. H20-H5]MEC3977636.1 hypothetical protein [Amycolatopsis sp. H20-H5]